MAKFTLKMSTKKQQNLTLISRLGSKKQDLKHFKHLIPADCTDVIEPFGGAFHTTTYIMRNKHEFPKAANFFVNDLDDIIYHIYTNPAEYVSVRNQLSTLCRSVEDKNYPLMRELMDAANVCDVCRDYVKNSTAVRGSIVKFLPVYDFSEYLAEMARISFTNSDYIAVIEQHRRNPGAFIFLDPPYMFSDNSQYHTKEGEKTLACGDCTDIPFHLYNLLTDEETKAKILLVINDMKMIRIIFDGLIIGEYGKTFSLSKKYSNLLLIANFKP